MPSAVDILAERVGEAADLIVSLRTRVQTLERELLAARTTRPAPSDQHQPPAPPPALVEELERLRSERGVVRETIRGLLREIDRVSW